MKIAMGIMAAIIVILLVILIRIIRRKPDGSIQINKSDPFKDYYVLNLDISFDDLDARKMVIFKVEEVQ